ncbi:hypothetical protein D3C73_915120 [compost metagenome]
MEQPAGAGDRAAQALQNPIQARRVARQRAAGSGHRAAQAGEQPGHRCAQIGCRAHLLRQVGDHAGNRRHVHVQCRADAAQRGLQAQGQHVIHGLAGVGQSGLQHGAGRAVQQAAGNTTQALSDRIQQAALARQASGQRAHGVRGVTQHGRQGHGIGGVRIQQVTRAGHGLAQAIHQAACASAQATRQAGALQGGAQVADQAACLRGDAIHGGAQAGRGADLLRQAHHGIDHGLYRGIQGLAYATQSRAQIQGQGIVDGVAGVAQRGLQQTRRNGVDRVIGIRAARIGRVRAARVGRNIRAWQAG